MKIFKINKVLEEILKYDLTPDEYMILVCLAQGKDIPERLYENMNNSINSLVSMGWVSSEGVITDKVTKSKIFGDYIDPNFSKNVEIYRSMWPSMTLPSGKLAKSPSRDLEVRFKWFFDNYDYTWEQIFKSTESYIEYYRERGYNFMRTSSFFIYKEDTSRIKSSDLAEWCDKVSSNEVEKSYHIDV